MAEACNELKCSCDSVAGCEHSKQIKLIRFNKLHLTEEVRKRQEEHLQQDKYQCSFNILHHHHQHKLKHQNQDQNQHQDKQHQQQLSTEPSTPKICCNCLISNNNNNNNSRQRRHFEPKNAGALDESAMSEIVNNCDTTNATYIANNLLATNTTIKLTAPCDDKTLDCTNNNNNDNSCSCDVSTVMQQNEGQLATIQREYSHLIDPNGKEFQIIWRQLAFEVNEVSNGSKLINGALNKFNYLWRLGTSRERRSQLTISKEDLENVVTGKNGNISYDTKQRTISTTTLGSISSSTLSSNYTNGNNGNYSSRSRSGNSSKRVIFENLNGYVKSGEVSAILGPSGAGKTSLLTAICGRTENYRGSIQLVGGGSRRMRLSIIPQKDYLLDNLTVRESLLYASKILNPNKSQDEHESNISRVVKMLNLFTCLDSNVGQISGGEYKRVSIAQELISQPDILVLDEPTSGLDSLNCKKLIKSLVQLIEASRQGKINPLAVVMTIHQPDIDVFNMFDHVYCMARNGNVIFDGHPKDAMQTIQSHAHFESDKLPPELAQAIESGSPVAANPANMLIEIASEDLYGWRPIDNLARLQRKQFEQMFGTTIQTSSGQTNDGVSIDIDMMSSPAQCCDHQVPKNNNDCNNQITLQQQQPQHYKRPPALIKDKRLSAKRTHEQGLFWYHTGLLTKRAFLATLRDPLSCLASLFFHISLPFIMYTVYSKDIGSVKACPLIVRDMDLLSMASNRTLTIVEDLQEQLSVSYECAAMYFLTTYSFSMCSTAIAALAFPLSMHVLLKEVRNGWYNLPTFVTAKTFASLPFEVLFPVISIVMLYFILGMPSSYMEWRLWGIALTCACIAMIGQTVGLIFGALFMDSVQTAVFVGLAASLPQALLSGYTARIKQMPAILRHFSWLSPFRYSMDLINMFRFGFGMCPCDDDMDDYLRTSEAKFLDVPSQMKPLIGYYLRNSDANDVSDSSTPTIEPSMAIINATIANLSDISSNSTSLSNAVADSAATAVNITGNYIKKRLAGINYDFMLSQGERDVIIDQIESKEIDLFQQMADQLTRSFAFGRKINSCSAARSQLLITFDTPEDDYLPNMLCYLFALLIGVRIILLIIVKLRVGSRL